MRPTPMALYLEAELQGQVGEVEDVGGPRARNPAHEGHQLYCLWGVCLCNGGFGVGRIGIVVDRAALCV